MSLFGRSSFRAPTCSLEVIRHRYDPEFAFFLLGFTPCKAEQSLQGMELQGEEAQKD